MTKKPKPPRYRTQCAKCSRKGPDIAYRHLMLTDIQGARNALALLCPACLAMFWQVYNGFIQTRMVQLPTHRQLPESFSEALTYHRQGYEEVIQELENEIHWHRQAIDHLQKTPQEVFLFPIKPLPKRLP